LKRFIFAIGIVLVVVFLAIAGWFQWYTIKDSTFVKSDYISADENYKSAPYGKFKNNSERTDSYGTDYYSDEMQNSLDLDYYNGLDLHDYNVLDLDDDGGC
jgi:uncharacterized protein YxeA